MTAETAYAPVPIATSTTRKSLVKIKDSTNFYPHQIDGVRDLARRTSFLLADEMGLGKSLQALTVAAIDWERNNDTRVLVIAPATLKWNWAAEMDAFTNFTYTVLDGTKKKRDVQLDEFVDDVLVINYEQALAHLDQLNDIGFDIVIADEAHYIKNPKAKRTKAFMGIAARRYFMLTGSPMLNHANDLWSILYRIDPLKYPNYWKFISKYCVFGGYQDKQIIGVKNQRELKGNLAAVMLRREKKDVLDLPDKMYVPVYVDLLPEQRKMYDEAEKEMKITLPDNPNPMELENALTKMLRLKQICGTTFAIDGVTDKSSKLDVGIERAAEFIDDGKPVVVFTQFRAVLACFEARARKAGLPVYTMSGDTAIRDRVPLIDQWQNCGKPAILLAMLQVAGVGLNMTHASNCIFQDKLWVPKLNEQAEDRMHRIGADRNVPITIVQILARHTVEQRIDMILKRKDKIFGELVNDDDWKRKLIEAIADDEEYK